MMSRIGPPPVSSGWCADTDTEIVDKETLSSLYWLISTHLYNNDEVLLARIEQFLRSLRDTFELGRDTWISLCWDFNLTPSNHSPHSCSSLAIGVSPETPTTWSEIYLGSHWSSFYITALSLVESFTVMKYFHSDATPALLGHKDQLEAPKGSY